MPKIETWGNFPPGVRQHLIDRMRDRAISIVDINRLRLWIDSKPEVPEDDWYKDFGSFKICGKGALPKTFLLRGQAAKGKAVSQSRGKPTVTRTFKRFPASFQPITGINPRNPEIHPLSSKQDRRGVALCVRLPAPEPPCLLPVKLKPKPKPPPPPPPVVEPAGAKSLTASPKTTSPRIGFVPSTPAPVPTPRRLSYKGTLGFVNLAGASPVLPLSCRA